MGDNGQAKYPVIFEHCPSCGSEERLGVQAIQELKDKGLLHKDSFNGGLVWQTPMLDQAHPPTILAPVFSVKVLLTYWDICGKCGTMYVTKFDCVDTQAQVQQQPPPPKGQMPPFGRRN